MKLIRSPLPLLLLVATAAAAASHTAIRGTGRDADLSACMSAADSSFYAKAAAAAAGCSSSSTILTGNEQHQSEGLWYCSETGDVSCDD